MDDETARRIRKRLEGEEGHASKGFAEGNRRNDRNMVTANAARMVAFGDAIKILEEETAKT